MKKEMICIMCPRGCTLHVSASLDVEGNYCPRGIKYAISEMTHPVRILTSTVKTTDNMHPRLPVKSNQGIPKDMIFHAMSLINHITVSGPISIGDKIIENIYPGIDIVATANL